MTISFTRSTPFLRFRLGQEPTFLRTTNIDQHQFISNLKKATNLIRFQYLSSFFSFLYASYKLFLAITLFPGNSPSCRLASQISLALYAISKICVYGFLISKALVPYQALDDWRSGIFSRKCVMTASAALLHYTGSAVDPG